jgi:hypothetical protein
MNKVLPAIVGGPATSPLQQSAEQIQNQRKRIKKISAAAESDFIIAGKQAEFSHSTQAKEHKLCCVEQHTEH